MHAPTVNRPRLPPEIKLELLTKQDGFLPRIAEIVNAEGVSDGDPAVWLKSLQDYLAGGEAMIVNARIGRMLVGFLVLDAANQSAPFSWVDARFRNRGLGERFYSFACINLAMPTPEFRFPQNLFEEYRGVLKAAGHKPMLRDDFYIVHERPKEEPETEAA